MNALPINVAAQSLDYWLIWTQDRRSPPVMFRSVQWLWPFFLESCDGIVKIRHRNRLPRTKAGNGPAGRRKTELLPALQAFHEMR